jgi:hypothetical protein
LLRSRSRLSVIRYAASGFFLSERAMKRQFAIAIFLVVAADSSAADLAVSLEKNKDGKPSAIAVGGLDDDVLSACIAREAKSPDWAAGAAVRIGGGKAEEIAQRAPMLGAWHVAGKRLVFEPRFPFLPGSSLHVTVDRLLLANPLSHKSDPKSFDLQMPKRDLTPVTRIEQIYPTRKQLPENQLRFYIQFSQPMMRGEAYEHIKLLDAKGKQLEEVFLELGEELWDPDMKRFTLLFHPGRVKQGLKPREELGPILEAGKSYTLVISGKWRDAESRELIQKELRKAFTAGPADDEVIDPKKWKLIAPRAGTRNAIEVHFGEPLDYGLSNRVIWIVGAGNKRVPGTIELTKEETVWMFVPEKAWIAGKYQVVAETILEDLAANSIGRPFEVDIFRPIPKTPETKTVEVPFEIKPPAEHRK